MQEFDCDADELGPYYPGQTVMFYFNPVINFRTPEILFEVIQIKLNEAADDACKSDNRSTQVELTINKCKPVKYVLSHNNGKHCAMYLKFSVIPFDDNKQVSYGSVEIYSVLFKPCPMGFKLREWCQCDPVLQSYRSLITSCDINDQTILRPANSWIIARPSNNGLYTYIVSLQCQFDYCLPHSSHLNLLTPDSQCQFNRSGVLCGHCQRGLSTVFGTSQCKHCSNIYLLITIPILISGAILVLILFILNLTVTDGDVNAFLFYVNVVSINTPVFFQRSGPSLEYILISLANLDLGIETCFYNGMDDYARMWLQLAFPAYLIVIATIIIILSRYSTGIQRLTANRALPVFATLFLLSYTKILLAVSSVLFFYSVITYLPGEHTTVVWEIDTGVSLFGLKFTILFIVCLILFLILIMFNIVLIFTRTLFWFRYISRFKPLLDAYQGPYKDKFYYWTGLQLVMRALFFGLSALDRSLNLLTGSLILGIMLALHGIIQPFKSKFRNVQELLLLLNLHGIYVASLYSISKTIAVRVLVILAFVQLVCIGLYHTKRYALAKCLANNKWNFSFAEKFCQIMKYFKKSDLSQANIQHGIQLTNAVPEVAYNYKQFRDNEPLSLGN